MFASDQVAKQSVNRLRLCAHHAQTYPLIDRSQAIGLISIAGLFPFQSAF